MSSKKNFIDNVKFLRYMAQNEKSACENTLTKYDALYIYDCDITRKLFEQDPEVQRLLADHVKVHCESLQRIIDHCDKKLEGK